MTVMAAEAGGAAVASRAAAGGGRSAAGGASRERLLSDPRSGARPLGGSDPGPRYERRAESHAEPSGPRGDSGTRKPPPPAGSSGGPGGSGAKAKDGGKRPERSPERRQHRRTALGDPEFKNYQGIILAEFVLAELLVSGTPIATRQHVEGLSPYIPRDIIKLFSLGLVYFLLELGAVAGPKWGRMGAWFGGLILLTVGLNEASNVAKVLDLFGSDKSGKKAADTGDNQNG